jgi:hypothetical protein
MTIVEAQVIVRLLCMLHQRNDAARFDGEFRRDSGLVVLTWSFVENDGGGGMP